MTTVLIGALFHAFVCAASLLARSPGSSWDRFAFRISLLAYSSSLHTRSMVLVGRYLTGGGGEWWDNNGGADYRVAFYRVASKDEKVVKNSGGEKGERVEGGERVGREEGKTNSVVGGGSPWLAPLNVPRRVVVSAPGAFFSLSSSFSFFPLSSFFPPFPPFPPLLLLYTYSMF